MMVSKFFVFFPCSTSASRSRPRHTSYKVCKPQPRYAKPTLKPDESAADLSRNYDSSESIRQAVFEEWKAKRLQNAKQELLEKQRKEKEIEEKKKKVLIKSKVNAILIFVAPAKSWTPVCLFSCYLLKGSLFWCGGSPLREKYRNVKWCL